MVQRSGEKDEKKIECLVKLFMLLRSARKLSSKTYFQMKIFSTEDCKASVTYDVEYSMERI